MELLERDGPLAALSEAHEQAAQGRGSVVLVTGEPGIGKTALVARFARDHSDQGRVLWGSCDDLAIARPFGPFRDLSPSIALDQLDGSPHRFHSFLLDELAASPGPTVLVLEDVHWADEATIDAITVIGRRIATLPAMMVLTYRSGELDPGHPFPSALETIRSGVSLYLQLAPLSRSAVAVLAGEEADRIYTLTGGNPFYINELLAAGPAEIPPSVANAVLGRASRLDEGSRRLVELVSMAPSRIPARILDMMMPDWPSAADEPERRQLLTVDPNYVRFRHELARAAVRSSVPNARRRLLHAEILEALLEADSDPAEIVHHAEEAGNTEVVSRYALVAARRAAAVESNREAYAHYLRASDFVDWLPSAEAAILFEELAVAAYTVDRHPEALSAIGRAIELNQEGGDQLAVGRCTRILSRCHWYLGDGDLAKHHADQAIRILEPLGESVELARAYSGLSQLAMLSADSEGALTWGERAVQLADRLGADEVKVHALVNIGSVHIQTDPADFSTLLEAHRLADRVGERHEAVRALLNLGYTAMMWADTETARRYTDEAVAYAEEHQVDALGTYVRMISAWLMLRAGEWTQAERTAGVVEASETGVNQLLAKTILTELAVRRGDEDAPERLAALAEQAERTGELQRIGPVLQLETEWALTMGSDFPREHFERVRPLIKVAVGWAEGVMAWAAVAGVDLPVAGRLPAPYSAMMDRDWARAADAFGAAGWDYDRAIMLSLLDDDASLIEALSIARRLGATPLDQRATRRMRELGHTVPGRPRDSTIANPAGLTARQLEVLNLLAEGLSNVEIADRLYISVRTVEHHVEGILTKLGVSSRREAARRYATIS